MNLSDFDTVPTVQCTLDIPFMVILLMNYLTGKGSDPNGAANEQVTLNIPQYVTEAQLSFAQSYESMNSREKVIEQNMEYQKPVVVLNGFDSAVTNPNEFSSAGYSHGGAS